MTSCASCGRSGPPELFRGAPTKAHRGGKPTRWCRPCREDWRARAASRPRALGTNPRARGTNPRKTATNPRARGTNAHPGKSEAAGQWRAAWRRIDRLDPERRHQLRRAVDEADRYLDLPELGDELVRRLD